MILLIVSFILLIAMIVYCLCMACYNKGKIDATERILEILNDGKFKI